MINLLIPTITFLAIFSAGFLLGNTWKSVVPFDEGNREVQKIKQHLEKAISFEAEAMRLKNSLYILEKELKARLARLPNE